jgi:hypothetical protein
MTGVASVHISSSLPQIPVPLPFVSPGTIAYPAPGLKVGLWESRGGQGKFIGRDVVKGVSMMIGNPEKNLLACVEPCGGITVFFCGDKFEVVGRIASHEQAEVCHAEFSQCGSRLYVMAKPKIPGIWLEAHLLVLCQIFFP